MSPCIVYNVLCSTWYISRHALWPQSFYVARVMFQGPKCSWQTAPYTSATIATISSKGMFCFSSFTSSWRLLRWPALKSFSSIHRFQLGKYWAWICTAVIYTRRRRKSWKFCFHLAKLLMCIVDYFFIWVWLIFCTHVLVIYSGVMFFFNLVTHTPTLQGFCADAHRFTQKY